MAFPSPATNGQQYEAGGYIYQFNSAKRTWTKVGVAANVVTTTPALTTNTVTSSNVTANAVTVGNVTLTSNTVSVGNTSVTANGVTVGNVTLTSNTVAVGNTSVTANGVAVGNVSLTSNGVSVGNTSLTGNGLSVGNVSLTSNGVSVGNVSLTSNAVTVGNVSLTSNGMTVGNVSVTSNAVTVGNVSLTGNGVSIGNVSLTGNGVSVGNVSLTGNGVSVGNVSLTSNGVSVGNVSLTSNGVSVGNVSLTSNGVSVGNVSLTSEGVTVGNVSLTSNGVSVGNVTLTENAVSVGNTSISDNAITTETVTATTVSQANAETGTTTTLTSGVLSLSNSLSNTTTTITSNSITSPTFYGNLVGSFLGTVAQVESLSNFTTSNLAEGSNLYFTNTRVVYALTAGNGVNITANGMITVFGAGVGGNVTSVNEQVGDVTLRTANIPESTSNLYFTNTRAVAAFVAGPGISINANGYIVSTAAGGGNASGNTTITVSSPLSNTFFSVRTTTASGNTLPITRTSGYGTADDWFNDGDTFSIDGYSYTIVSIADANDPNGNATFTIEETLVASASAGTALFKYSQFSNDVTKIVVGNGINLVSSGNTATISIGSGGGAIVEYVNGQTGNVQLTTANIPEYSSNLYFTNTRVVYALTAGNGVNITANGMITVFGAGVGGNVTSVNQLVGDVTLRTANIPESTSNLYFTNARVYANISPLLNTNTVTEGANLYFTNTRAVYAFTPGSGLTIAANGLISSTASVSITQSNTQSNASLTIEPGSGLTQSNTASGVTSVYGSNVSLSNSQSNTSVSIDTSGVTQSNATTGTVSVIGAGNVALSNTLSNTSVSIQSGGVTQSNTTSGTNSTISSSVVGLSNTLSNTSVSIQSGGVVQSNVDAGTNSTISSSVVGLSNTLSNTSVSIQSSGVAQSNTTAGTNSTISSSVVGLSNSLSNTTVTIQSSGVTQSNTTTGTVSVIGAGNVALSNTLSNTVVDIQSSGVTQNNQTTGTVSSFDSSTLTLQNTLSNATVSLGSANGLVQGNTTTGTTTTINSSNVALANTLSNTTVTIQSTGVSQSNTTSGTTSTVNSSTVALANTISNTSVSIQSTGVTQANTTTGTVSVINAGNVALTNTQSGSTVTVTSDGIVLSNALTGKTVTLSSNISTSTVPEGANLYFTNSRAIGAFTAGSGLILAPNGLILSTVSTSVQQTNVESNTTVSLNPSGGLVQSNLSSGSVSIIGSGNVVLQNTIVNVNITIEANGIVQNNQSTGSVSNLDSSGISFQNTQSGTSTTITSNSITSPTFVGNLVGTVSTLSNFTTSNLAEGANLYFTNTRAIYALTGGSGIVIAANGRITANVQSVSAELTTSNIAEGANLYFTNTRVVYALTAGNGVNIAANGRITVFGGGVSNVTSVNQLTGDITLSTANIPESGNLYFTNTRVVYALTAGNGVNIAANGRITVFGAGVGGNVTSVNELTGDITLTTSNINEGTRLYFTNTRSIGALTAGPGIIIAANGYLQANVAQSGGSSSNVTSVNGANGDVVLTTANIAESGNLYFTNTRAISALTAGSGITIAANGRITVQDFIASNAVNSVNGQTGNVVLTTTNINEGSNLYFTNTRAVSAFTAGSGIVIAANGLVLSTVSTQVAQSNTQSGSNVVLQPSTGLTQSNTQSNTTTTLNSGSLAIACTQVSVNINLGGLFQNSTVSGTVSTISTSSIGISNTFSGTSVTIQPGNGLIQSSTVTGTSTIVSSSNVALSNTSSGSSVTFTSEGITLSNTQTGQVRTITSDFTTASIPESGNLYFTNARVYANVLAQGFATNSSVTAQLSAKANTASLTTANVSEVTNLYFTNTRAISALTAGSGISIAANGRITSNVSAVSASLTTSNIAEGANLYFTNTRAIAAFTNGSGISIAANGRITAFGPVTGNVTSVNGLFGEVNLDTGNVFESGNLYFTNARVYSNVIQLGLATTTYVNNQLANLVASAPATLDTLSELATALGNDASFATTVTNSIATKASNAFVLEQLNLKANVSQLTTANITESGSLYFTNTRAIGAFTSGSGIDIASNGRITSTVVGGVSSVNGQTGAVTLTTASISELTNLYFTNSRSRSAFTAGQNISIAANGRITANVSAIAGNYDFGTFLAPASQRFRLRRGLESDRTSFIPLEGELIYVTDTKRVYVGDGTTAGGILVSSITQDYDGGAPTTIIFDDTLDGGFYDTTSFDDSLDLGSP